MDLAHLAGVDFSIMSTVMPPDHRNGHFVQFPVNLRVHHLVVRRFLSP